MDKKFVRAALVILGVAAMLQYSSRLVFGTSLFSTSLRDTRQLEAAFAVIERYRVTDYLYMVEQDWT